MKSTYLAASVFLLAFNANAASLTIPGLPFTVAGTDVFSGPSFVVSGNFTGDDTLSLTAIGTVDLADGQFTANAAGIVVSPLTTNTGAHPGEFTLSGGIPYAALLIGNGSLGFHPVFAASAANGLGNATPPTTLTITDVLLSDIFGGPVAIADGTVLEFRINDINSGDNSGGYRLTQAEAVPEPATVMLVAGALSGLVLLRRRRS